MPEERAGKPASPGAVLSRKQTVGFLIDSAANLHQICIRVLLSQEEQVSFPDYDPAAWVIATRYQEMAWRVLIDLCVTYNRVLYDLCDRFPAEKFSNVLVRIGNRQARPLLEFVQDHVANVRQRVKELAG